MTPCDYKHHFRTHRDASRVARKYGQAVYRCRACGDYHLTSGHSRGKAYR